MWIHVLLLEPWKIDLLIILLRPLQSVLKYEVTIFFFFAVLFIYLFYNIVFLLPYIDMNLPWVYMTSPSWTPLPPCSPSHPSGLSQCTSPEHPVSCIEPGLAIHFTYDIILFQCHSPKSSHPRPLPQSPKDCSIHLCLFCYLTYRVIIPIFLNFIYMH